MESRGAPAASLCNAYICWLPEQACGVSQRLAACPSVLPDNAQTTCMLHSQVTQRHTCCAGPETGRHLVHRQASPRANSPIVQGLHRPQSPKSGPRTRPTTQSMNLMLHTDGTGRTHPVRYRSPRSAAWQGSAPVLAVPLQQPASRSLLQPRPARYPLVMCKVPTGRETPGEGGRTPGPRPASAGRQPYAGVVGGTAQPVAPEYEVLGKPVSAAQTLLDLRHSRSRMQAAVLSHYHNRANKRVPLPDYFPGVDARAQSQRRRPHTHR